MLTVPLSADLAFAEDAVPVGQTAPAESGQEQFVDVNEQDVPSLRAAYAAALEEGPDSETPLRRITALDPEDFQLPTTPDELLKYLVKDYVQLEAELTLEEAMELALRHNHALNSVRMRAASACAGVDVRWADLKPQVSLQSRLFTSFENGGGGTGSGQDENEDTDGELAGTLSLDLTQRIYDFGRTRASVDQAEALHAIQKYAVDQAEQQLVFDVIVSYIRFNLALGQAKVRDDELRLSEEFLRQANVQFDVGVVPRLDVLRAEARLEEARSSFIAAQATVGDTAADFFALLGVEDCRFVPAIVTRDFVELGEAAPDLNAVIGLGLETRPEIEVQYSTLFSREAARELAKNRPILEAFASSFLRQPEQDFQSTMSQEFGVLLRWDLYTGGRDKAQRREIELELASLSEGVLELETQVERDVTKAWNRLVAARGQADAARKNLELTAESLRVANIGYRAGVTPYIDFIDAFDKNVAAALGYVLSLAEVRLAHANLARAQGFPMGYPGDSRVDVPGGGGLREILGLTPAAPVEEPIADELSEADVADEVPEVQAESDSETEASETATGEWSDEAAESSEAAQAPGEQSHG